MNRKEFERMAPPLRERIVNMVMAMSASVDHVLADDVAQDTMLKLWTLRDKLDEYRNIDSLAMVIARHRNIDLLRSASNKTSGLDDISESHLIAPSPEENIIDRESLKDLMSIMASLPSVQQTVIRMRHIEGLEISEIAAITGATPGAIRVALSRARQNIKDIFMQRIK